MRFALVDQAKKGFPVHRPCQALGVSQSGYFAWKALIMRRPPKGLIHHSDRGSQYCSVDHQAELRRHGIRISMSGKENCHDNTMVETCFKTIKSELVWRTVFYTRAEAGQAIARYINALYNPVRRHSTLDYISPAQFKRTASRRANTSPF